MLKNILNLKGVVQLNREQQKSINGGDEYLAPAACSADCLDREGNLYSITCSGNNCTSSDFSGCSSDSESKKCMNIF